MRPIRLICPILCAVTLTLHSDPIDLPTVLRLAGAQNIDVQVAAEKLNEARAAEESTQLAFFPWVVAGAGYKAHNGAIQTVDGQIISTDKQSYNVGPTVGIQLDLGDALYKRLAAKQLTKAAEHGADAQQRQSVLEAAETYFDLCKAQANATVANEALKTSKEYEDQIGNAVKAGVAFKGDELRAHTQLKRYELLEQQAAEQRRTAAARLAQILNLDGKVNLTPSNRDLVPLKLAPSGGSSSSLVTQALANRPELKQGASLSDAAQTGARGARLAPLVPSLGAQVFGGGLGGGVGSDAGNFGGSGDYQITLGWRIGPGGLFDRSRVKAAESKAQQAALIEEKISDGITREVVENFERVKLLREQLVTSKDGVGAALEALREDGGASDRGRRRARDELSRLGTKCAARQRRWRFQ